MTADVWNIFVLSADSLRIDYFDRSFGQIASQIYGVRFTNAVATASHTKPSVPTLAAGVYVSDSAIASSISVVCSNATSLASGVLKAIPSVNASWYGIGG